MGVEASETVAARAPARALRARSFRVAADLAEADGTLAWDPTTLVFVEVDAEGKTGLGYRYTAPAAAG